MPTGVVIIIITRGLCEYSPCSGDESENIINMLNCHHTKSYSNIREFSVDLHRGASRLYTAPPADWRHGSGETSRLQGQPQLTAPAKIQPGWCIVAISLRDVTISGGQ